MELSEKNLSIAVPIAFGEQLSLGASVIKHTAPLLSGAV
jgi:hypothetical protein